LSGPDARRRVGRGSAIDEDATVVHESPRRGPGQLRQVPPENRGEREPRLGRRYVERVLRTRTRSRRAA
jgi:hypothetical protein